MVVVEGFEGTPDEVIKPTNKKAVSVFEQVAPDLKTNDKCEATYKVCFFILSLVMILLSKDALWVVKGKGTVTAESLSAVQIK